MTGKDYCLDIAVTSPYAKQAIDAQRKDGNLLRYFDLKVKNLKDDVKALNYEFQPIILSTLGEWELSAVSILKRIAKISSERLFQSYPTLVFQMFQKLSISLQRSNARSLLSRFNAGSFANVLDASNFNSSPIATVSNVTDSTADIVDDDLLILNPDAPVFVPSSPTTQSCSTNDFISSIKAKVLASPIDVDARFDIVERGPKLAIGSNSNLVNSWISSEAQPQIQQDQVSKSCGTGVSSAFAFGSKIRNYLRKSQQQHQGIKPRKFRKQFRALNNFVSIDNDMFVSD
jgi:hypothetical protein